MSIKVTPPFEFFTELNGAPLEAGKIFIGLPGLDAETNPQTVTWDEEFTIPAAQPIRTVAGVPDQSGTPSNFFADGDYSITVLDKNDVLVYSKLNVDGSLISGISSFSVAPTQSITLPLPPNSSQHVLVYLDGIIQRPDIDYTVVGDILTFVDTIPDGLSVISGIILAVGDGGGGGGGGGTDPTKVAKAGDEMTGNLIQKSNSLASFRYDRGAGTTWGSGIFAGSGQLIFSKDVVEQARIEPRGINLNTGEPTTLLTRELADTRYAQLEGLTGAAFKRSFVVELPFTTAFIRANEIATAYPQAMAFNEPNNEVYVLHSNGTAGSFITVWNMTTGAIKTEFRVSSGTGREALVYREHDSKRWLYAIGLSTPYRIDITTLPTTGSTVTPSGADLFSSTTDALTQMGWNGNNFFYANNTAQNPGGVNSKHNFIIAGADFSATESADSVTFPISAVGSFNEYIDAFPKSQGVTWHNGMYVFGTGGVYDTSGTPDDPTLASTQQGLVFCNTSGDVVTTALCNPDTCLTLFGNMVSKTLGVIENEGIFSDGNTVMSLWQTLTSAEFNGPEGLTHGIIIAKELSEDATAVDFSDGSYVPKINIDQRVGLPIGVGAQLKNPINGEDLNSLDRIIDMMTGLALDDYNFYGTNQTIIDVDGATVAVTGSQVRFTLSAAAGCLVEIKGDTDTQRYWISSIQDFETGSKVVTNGQLQDIEVVTTTDWSSIGGPNPASVGDQFVATSTSGDISALGEVYNTTRVQVYQEGLGVVDSGLDSNTKWTKLQGGKMLMQHTFQELTFANANQVTGDWNFPETFTAVPTVVGTINATATLAEGNAVTLAELGPVQWVTSGDDNNIGRMTIFKHPGASNFVAGDKVLVRVSAEGRWD